VKSRGIVAALIAALLLGLAAPLLLQTPAQAQMNLRRPNYFQAVSELRDARWLAEHRDGGPLEERERNALGEIDRALEDVERAANIDARFAYQRPRDDAYPGPARLRRVSELLRAARADVSQSSDVNEGRDDQHRAIEHIDTAIRITEDVMLERERGREHDRDRERDYDRR
jgi:hypothetical protein